MVIADNSPVNAAASNAAWMSRTADTSTAGAIDQTKSTQSTTTTTGAFKTAGGIGVVKNAYIGGNLDVAGTGHVTGALTIDDKLNIATENNTSTGTDQTLSLPKFLVRLTAGLTSICGITAPSAAQPVILVNDTGGSISIKNDTTATAANRIITGTGANITLVNNASLLLAYDLTETRWRVIGSTATSASAATYTNTSISGNYTALTTDGGVTYTGVGGHTLTLYAASAQDFPLDVFNFGTGNLTIARAGSDTIVGETSQTLVPNSGIRLISDRITKFGTT